MQVQELEISALRSDNDEPRKLALLIFVELSCPLEFILQLEIKTHAKNTRRLWNLKPAKCQILLLLMKLFLKFYSIGKVCNSKAKNSPNESIDCTLKFLLFSFIDLHQLWNDIEKKVQEYKNLGISTNCNCKSSLLNKKYICVSSKSHQPITMVIN